MKIHHLRNATMVIESGEKVILVDPMLGKKGKSGPPFSFFRSAVRWNPTVDLPKNAMSIIEKMTHCLITHLHPDHLDKAGVRFLISRQIPVICSVKDENTLKKKGLKIFQTVDYWEETDFLGGKIQGIPAVHGYGFIARLMGNVMGFHIKFSDEKTLYLSSDTIYTDDVHRVLTQLKPYVSVIPCGTAQFDIFRPLMFRLDDILKFIKNTDGKVIANHMEAVNHCTTTRNMLRAKIRGTEFSEKILIPDDGNVLVFS